MIVITDDWNHYYVDECGRYLRLTGLISITTEAGSYNSENTITLKIVDDVARAASIEDYLARLAMEEL